MFVRRWMTAPVVMLPAETPLPEALRFMEGRRIRHIAVPGAHGPVGVVQSADLQRALASADPFAPRARRLGDLAFPPILTVTPDLPVERAAEMMLLNGVSGVPVLENGRLVGMLTASDVLRAFTYVMGVCESGARLFLGVPERGDLLEQVRLKSRGLVVRSLVACPSPDGGLEVVMRVRGRQGITAA
jgi:acetoin utilization protein AcuB